MAGPSAGALFYLTEEELGRDAAALEDLIEEVMVTGLAVENPAVLAALQTELDYVLQALELKFNKTRVRVCREEAEVGPSG